MTGEEGAPARPPDRAPRRRPPRPRLPSPEPVAVEGLFRLRLLETRESWRERRALAPLARRLDAGAQLEILAVLHRHAERMLSDLEAVYGAELAPSLSPLDLVPGGEGARFTLTLAPGHEIALALVRRPGQEGDRWRIVAESRTGGEPVRIERDRRRGYWTRGRLESMVLNVVASYERRRPP